MLGQRWALSLVTTAVDFGSISRQQFRSGLKGLCSGPSEGGQ